MNKNLKQKYQRQTRTVKIKSHQRQTKKYICKETRTNIKAQIQKDKQNLVA